MSKSNILLILLLLILIPTLLFARTYRLNDLIDSNDIKQLPDSIQLLSDEKDKTGDILFEAGFFFYEQSHIKADKTQREKALYLLTKSKKCGSFEAEMVVEINSNYNGKRHIGSGDIYNAVGDKELERENLFTLIQLWQKMMPYIIDSEAPKINYIKKYNKLVTVYNSRQEKPLISYWSENDYYGLRKFIHTKTDFPRRKEMYKKIFNTVSPIEMRECYIPENLILLNLLYPYFVKSDWSKLQNIILRKVGLPLDETIDDSMECYFELLKELEELGVLGTEYITRAYIDIFQDKTPNRQLDNYLHYTIYKYELEKVYSWGQHYEAKAREAYKYLKLKVDQKDPCAGLYYSVHLFMNKEYDSLYSIGVEISEWGDYEKPGYIEFFIGELLEKIKDIRALQFYMESAKKGCSKAYSRLGTILEHSDIDEAIFLYQKSDSFEAYSALSKIYSRYLHEYLRNNLKRKVKDWVTDSTHYSELKDRDRYLTLLDSAIHNKVKSFEADSMYEIGSLMNAIEFGFQIPDSTADRVISLAIIRSENVAGSIEKYINSDDPRKYFDNCAAYATYCSMNKRRYLSGVFGEVDTVKALYWEGLEEYLKVKIPENPERLFCGTGRLMASMERDSRESYYARLSTLYQEEKKRN
jgi:hypothetical protein